MKQMFFALMISSSLAFAASTTKTTKTETKTTTEASLTLIHTPDLEKMMKADKNAVHIFDVNNEKTRQNDGLIPGAKMINSSTAYDTSILPADKNASLVFYCANTKCMASHEAAKVAIKNGYKNVLVMADGIQGWKKDGKPTDKYSKN
jgi:rhodanese-related sulfurtransferase